MIYKKSHKTGDLNSRWMDFIVVLPFLQLGEYVYERYIPALLSVVVLGVFLLTRSTRKIFVVTKRFYIGLISGVFLSVILSIGVSSFELLAVNFVKLWLAISGFFFFWTIFEISSNEANIRRFTLIAHVILLVAAFEALMRISSLGANISGLISIFSSNFYHLKFGSPFFNDSNAAALFLLPVFALFNIDGIKIRLWVIIIAYSLLFLTFSRAAVISVLLGYSVFVFIRAGFFARILMVLSVFIVFFSNSGMAYIQLVLSDGSLSTKIDSYLSLYNKVGDMSIIHLLFGAGVLDGSLLYGYDDGKFAHALIPMLMGQAGWLGVLIFMISLLYIFMRYHKTRFFIGLLFIVGLSYLPPFLESNFIVLGALCGYSVQRFGSLIAVGHNFKSAYSAGVK